MIDAERAVANRGKEWAARNALRLALGQIGRALELIDDAASGKPTSMQRDQTG